MRQEAHPPVEPTPHAVDGVSTQTGAAAPSISELLRREELASDGSGPDAADVVGGHIGKYPVERRLGSGGMGSVWLGHHPDLDIPVAIKVPSPLLVAHDPDFVTRFLLEARTAAQINHPNVVRFYDAGCDGGRYYIVMEYVDGGTVRDRLKAVQGPLPLDEALCMVDAIAAALEAAAKFRIIHRDIKPENIMLDSTGTAKLADLGLAKQLGRPGPHSETGAGLAMGTPGYMAPEQARDARSADARADIYALGATLYHMVTGGPPFEAVSPFELMLKHVRDPLPPPETRNPRLPAPVGEVIGKMMAKDPEQRYQTAAALRVDLQRVREQLATAGQAGSPVRQASGVARHLTLPVWAQMRRFSGRRTVLVGGLLGLVLVLAVVAGLVQQWSGRRTPRPDLPLPGSPTSGSGLEPVARFAPFCYTEDFTTDPGWTTEDARNLHHDAADGTFRGHQVNTEGTFAYIAWPDFNPNAPWRLEFDVTISATEESAGLTVGLFDHRLRYLHGVTVDQGQVQEGRTLVLMNYGVADRESAPAWSHGVWYRHCITYDPVARRVNLVVHDRATGADLMTLTTSTDDPFPDTMRRFGVSRLHMKNTGAGSSPTAAVDFSLDNVRLLSGSWLQTSLATDTDPVPGASGVLLDGLAAGSQAAQEAQQRAMMGLGLPLEVKTKQTGIVLRLVPAGGFTMGSADDDNWANPGEKAHQVTLTQAFYCGKYEITQTQWQAVMGTNPARFTPVSDAPVEQVTWEETQRFLEKLCALEGVATGTYRLPTEAEWEYACRAGTTGSLPNGELTAGTGRCPNLDQVAWYGANSGDATHVGGERLPNAWGLYDLLGNVWEWCGDWKGGYGAGVTTDPRGPAAGRARVIRGGAWNNDARSCRSAARNENPPDFCYADIGFRVVRVVPPTDIKPQSVAAPPTPPPLTAPVYP